MPQLAQFVSLAVFGLIALIVLYGLGRYFGLWVTARTGGAPVPYAELLAMRMRKVDPNTIVTNLIHARQAGLDLTCDQLQSHYMAGGRVTKVVGALIEAERSGETLTWEEATVADLSGRDDLLATAASLRGPGGEC